MKAEARAGLRTSDFEYQLPEELIAQHPSERRGEDRLLVVERSGGRAVLEDRRFSELAELIPPGDLLVLNSTKVSHARLLGRRASGAPAELLLIRRDSDGTWIAMAKPGRALTPGKRIELSHRISVEVLETLEQGYRRVRFIGASGEGAMQLLGKLPLPPYIEREPAPADDERYQTVFAEREGSVAAPTAGLHFTTELLHRLEQRGVEHVYLDLEVGPGTFKPVEEEDFTRHPMHPERYTIPEASASAIARARARGAAVWAVGTTVVRALESAARGDGTIAPGSAETRLLIVPGFRFRVVDRLLTNFHLPRSTLLMLVAAFAGFSPTMEAYAHAVRARYRFYSYGDAMLVL